MEKQFELTKSQLNIECKGQKPKISPEKFLKFKTKLLNRV